MFKFENLLIITQSRNSQSQLIGDFLFPNILFALSNYFSSFIWFMNVVFIDVSIKNDVLWMTLFRDITNCNNFCGLLSGCYWHTLNKNINLGDVEKISVCVCVIIALFVHNTCTVIVADVMSCQRLGSYDKNHKISLHISLLVVDFTVQLWKFRTPDM